jgi:hypothetical protein
MLRVTIIIANRRLCHMPALTQIPQMIACRILLAIVEPNIVHIHILSQASHERDPGVRRWGSVRLQAENLGQQLVATRHTLQSMPERLV